MTSAIPPTHAIGRRELASGTVVFCQSSPPETIFRHVLDTYSDAGAFILDHHGSTLPIVIHELARLNRLQDLVVLSPNPSFATATFADPTGFTKEFSASPIGDIPSAIEEKTMIEVPADATSAWRLLRSKIGETFFVGQSGRTLTESRIISRTIRMDASLFVPKSLAAILCSRELQELLVDARPTHNFSDTLARGTVFVWHAPQLAAAIPIGRILLRQFRTAMRLQLGHTHEHGRSVLCYIAGAAEEYLADDDQWLRPGALAGASVVDVFGVTRIATWNTCAISGGNDCEEMLGVRVFCGQNSLIRFKEGKWLKRAGQHFHSACGLNTVIGGDGKRGLWVRTWPHMPEVSALSVHSAIQHYWALQIQAADEAAKRARAPV